MSKIFKLTLASMFVAAFALTASASTATFTTNMMVGSNSEDVRGLQMFLNSCSDTALDVTAGSNGSKGFESKYFGMATKAAVMKYQEKVLGAGKSTGYFGNMSRTAASTMGNACGTGSGSTVAGCSAGAMFNSITGASCSTGSTVAGCSAGAMYSSTTGASCTGSTVVTGGAGSATITELSTPSTSTKVSEGSTNTNVYGVEIEADSNSDLTITSMKLTLSNSGSGSKKLNRYAKGVSIWYNGAKVGSATAAEFSEDSNTYSKSIAINNAVVKAGNNNKGKFYVAVDALEDIDSGNVSSTYNTWTVTLASTRYQDGTGAILTDSTSSLNNTFVFDSVSNTNDMELQINLDPSTLVARTVKVSTTADTNQVELMKFTMKAKGSKMVIDQIPVSFTTTGTLFETTGNVTLKIDGGTFNESIAAGTSTDGGSTVGTASTAVRIFDDLNIQLDADETVTGTVLADINDIDPNFAEGVSLSASLTSTIVTAISGNYIDAEDLNGDPLVAGDRAGSAIGNAQVFRSTGVNVVMGTPTYSNVSDSNGVVTLQTFTIPVTATAFGATLYIGQAGQFAATATASNSFAVVYENSSTPTTADVTSSGTIAISTTDALVETNGYRLDADQAKHFTIEVTQVTPGLLGAVSAGNYRVRLDDIRYFTGAGLESTATATSVDLLPTTAYRTGFKYITS